MKKYVLITLGVLLISAVVFAWFIFDLFRDLPDVAVLKRYRPAAATEVLDKNGFILTHYFEKKIRIWTPLSALPDLIIHAVITAEDDTFFGHNGVNYKATWDALVHDVHKRRFARGGSTITQQMIKNVMLSKEKTITRKLREYVLARRAEELLSKRRILEIYLNEVEWGTDVYGVEAASRYYFDKHAANLTIAEAALLAGMLPNPKYYDPFKRPAQARKRQERVLSNMVQAKLISSAEFANAMAESLNLREQSRLELISSGKGGQKPCYQRVLEAILIEEVGAQKLYRQGLRIATTLDKRLQVQFAGSEDDAFLGSGLPDMIMVIKEGDEIRALSCTTGNQSEPSPLLISNEDAPAGESVMPRYSSSILALDQLKHEHIVRKAPQAQ